MPYIKDEWNEIVMQGRREMLNPAAHGVLPETAGEVNFCITMVILDYLQRLHKTHYVDYNEAIGVFECAKLEFYRRKVATYEDTKVEENGDVY